jgi:hypothetical protein
VIKDGQTDAAMDQTAFEFKPPEGATKLDMEALAKLDEPPPASRPKGR